MKPTTILLTAIAASTVCAQAQETSTPPPAATGQWTTKQLTEHFWSEGACSGDVNKDGKGDILSGPYWYEGPAFEKRHTIYKMDKSFKRKKDDGAEETVPGFKGLLSGENEYSNNFVSYAYDFNGDGWQDYLVIGFPGAATYWFENPQGKDELWQRHTVLDVTDNESPMFVDVDGDKQPDLLCMSKGMMGYAKYDAKDPKKPWTWVNVSGTPDTKKYQRFTHGIGYGDLNGDGLTDLLEGTGWWERPKNWDGTTPWKKHDVMFGMGAQMYGYDVNGDGRTDVIGSVEAHGWGVVWHEQKDDGGAVGWTKHVIVGGGKHGDGETGVRFSQPHAIDFADMNGDGVMDIVTGKRVWAHGPKGDAEPNAPAVLWWFELKREGGKAKWTPHFVDGNSGIGTQVMAIDINGDKKLDVVVGNKRGTFVHTRK